MVEFITQYRRVRLGDDVEACCKSKPLHLVAVKDVGHFAAEAFLHPEEWAGESISLAGDHLTFADANKIFQQRTGKTMPQIPTVLAYTLMLAASELKIMFRWFGEVGYDADVDSLRKIHPGLLSWGDWVEQESKFKAPSKN